MRRVIGHVQAELQVSELFARRIVQTVIGGIEERLLAGDQVMLPGFGIFHLKRVGAKTARNPQTGKTVKIKAGFCPAWRASGTLRARVRVETRRKTFRAGVDAKALAVDSAPDDETE